MFESLYLDILNKHAPQKQAHIRGNQIPFMNEQWRKAIRHRNKLWKKFTHQRTDANYTPNIRNIETNARQLGAKRLKIILKTSQRPTIHVQFGRLIVLLCIRGQVNKPMTLRTLIENDVLITDKKELAELFNNYFVHIIDDVQDIKEHNLGHEFSAHPSIRAIAEENRRKNAIHNFNFKYTNKNQSEKLLLNINARKACGHDTITPRLLKESASCF